MNTLTPAEMLRAELIIGDTVNLLAREEEHSNRSSPATVTLIILNGLTEILAMLVQLHAPASPAHEPLSSGSAAVSRGAPGPSGRGGVS